MSFELIATPSFRKDIKKLGKKYPSLKVDLGELFESLKSNPIQGTPLGNHCYKIRLAISSKGKGKSGGARVVTYLHITESTIYLLTVFDKSDQENIPNADLKRLLDQIQ
ncbi:MAG: type II toxin-antitoxin system RelE/ParE family toxin [Flavobacteriales bacterium]|jgi:mRNA-degrading endonuclease RelE of RelBE toxin-antitoxin system|nr:type II toxin-antitoxin system RelE/ParE family toxin [Flavobacteriales bacterium]